MFNGKYILPKVTKRANRLIYFLLLAVILFSLSSCVIFPKSKTIKYSGNKLKGVNETNDAQALKVITWNLGYSGLGKEEDFFADGGKSIRVSDKQLAEKYAKSIVKFLSESSQEDVSVFLLQEAAFPSFSNRGVNLTSKIVESLPEYSAIYDNEYRIRLPFGMGTNTGLLLLSKANDDDEFEVLSLPSGKSKINLGRHFPLQILVTNLGEHQVAIFNIHLSAFDKEAKTRRLQLNRIFEIAEAQLAMGRHIIIGGDFNLTFKSAFDPYTSKSEDIDWIFPLNPNDLPIGFRPVFYPEIPTFRTLDKPYVAGENLSAILDGYIVSENIFVCEITTSNLGFRASDHNPVMLKFIIEDTQNGAIC